MKKMNKINTFYKITVFSVLLLFSYSILNSSFIGKITGFKEFESIAYAKKSDDEKAAEQAAKAEAKAEIRCR